MRQRFEGANPALASERNVSCCVLGKLLPSPVADVANPFEPATPRRNADIRPPTASDATCQDSFPCLDGISRASADGRPASAGPRPHGAGPVARVLGASPAAAAPSDPPHAESACISATRSWPPVCAPTPAAADKPAAQAPNQGS